MFYQSLSHQQARHHKCICCASMEAEAGGHMHWDGQEDRICTLQHQCGRAKQATLVVWQGVEDSRCVLPEANTCLFHEP